MAAKGLGEGLRGGELAWFSDGGGDCGEDRLGRFEACGDCCLGDVDGLLPAEPDRGLFRLGGCWG